MARKIMTPEEQERWRIAAQEEDAARSDLIARYEQGHAAAQEETFSGWLRRLMLERRDVHLLNSQLGIPWPVLGDFLAGEGELPSKAIDRILLHYGVQLPAVAAPGEHHDGE